MRTFIVELGTGADLHGRDATRAAIKAVKNAFNHVSLPGLRAVAGLSDLSQMEVELRLGVPPGLEPVDTDVVAAAFPHGRVRVEVGPGGLEAPGGGPDPNDTIVVVNAVIYVRVP